ncbi:O-methyltransferase [Eubacterium oxidoreducens]|uniref:tRNA 5-hydroxyuridine methyltransferase n=1 Tax=Eubacterium oxidoreducens TaxID=1732 RepID=A0A1G6BG35_EUBOX|nr:O-methyltransferase [Eubacterium oxidoreducens]SDB19548.1 Predicted O-methyltransferase YrrM [Eubacterium oxidoreducens]
MIVEERMQVFLDSMEPLNVPYLEELEQKAMDDDVPIIRKNTQSLIKTLLMLKKPVRILEVGTAVGFSALLMKESCNSIKEIVTIENYAPRIQEAKRNFEKYDKDGIIRLIEGDAMKELPLLEGEFDLVFMDAAKGQYIRFLPEVTRLLKCNGLLISDNVLQEGELIESHYVVERRNRTIHKRMREYLYTLMHSEDYESSILPVGDGVALSVKR